MSFQFQHENNTYWVKEMSQKVELHLLPESKSQLGRLIHTFNYPKVFEKEIATWLTAQKPKPVVPQDNSFWDEDK